MPHGHFRNNQKDPQRPRQTIEIQQHKTFDREYIRCRSQYVSHLQISSAAAIDAEIAEAQKSLESGAELFIGGHGGAAKTDAVQFKISYLKKMKDVLEDSRTAQDFMDGMKKAYPDLPGADGLGELAKALYK